MEKLLYILLSPVLLCVRQWSAVPLRSLSSTPTGQAIDCLVEGVPLATPKKGTAETSSAPFCVCQFYTLNRSTTLWYVQVSCGGYRPHTPVHPLGTADWVSTKAGRSQGARCPFFWTPIRRRATLDGVGADTLTNRAGGTPLLLP